MKGKTGTVFGGQVQLNLSGYGHSYGLILLPKVQVLCSELGIIRKREV